MIYRWEEEKTDTMWHCIYLVEGDKGNSGGCNMETKCDECDGDFFLVHVKMDGT